MQRADAETWMRNACEWQLWNVCKPSFTFIESLAMQQQKEQRKVSWKDT